MTILKKITRILVLCLPFFVLETRAVPEVPGATAGLNAYLGREVNFQNDRGTGGAIDFRRWTDFKMGPLPKPSTGPGPKRPVDLRIGDWNSSGAPEPVYEPPYDFQYSCQIHLTDNFLRKETGTGATYQYYAIAEFELENKKTMVSTQELEWYGRKVDEKNRVSSTDDRIPFAVSGSYVGLRFHRGTADDSMELKAYLQQEIRGLLLTQAETVRATRSQSELHLFVKMNLTNAPTSRPVPQMSLRLMCSRVK